MVGGLKEQEMISCDAVAVENPKLKIPLVSMTVKGSLITGCPLILLVDIANKITTAFFQ